jgi:TonB family protein
MFTSLNVLGQSIDTIYLDSRWNKTNKNQYTYFRVLTKVNNELYECKDYWKSGEMQMSGKLSSLYPETREDKFIWYNKNGSIKQIIFYRNNQQVGLVKSFDDKGDFEFEYCSNLDSLDNSGDVKRSINNFWYYVSKKLKYPKSAIQSETEGKVVTQFYINEAGEVFRFEIVKSVNEEMDTEARRIVLSYNKWSIPRYKGKNTKIFCSFPIIYQLK